MNRVKELTGKELKFYECDILDREGLKKIFKENEIEGVIHFAGLKAVGESCRMPSGILSPISPAPSLFSFEVMKEFNVKNLVFSSSATVYGMTGVSPLVEDMKQEMSPIPMAAQSI